MISSRSFFCLRSKYGWIRSRNTRAQRYARRACMGLSRPQATNTREYTASDKLIHHTAIVPLDIYVFTSAPTAAHNLPCIGVTANANGVGELCLKRWKSTESAGEDEVKQAPQLAEVVLNRRSGQDKTVHSSNLLADECNLHNDAHQQTKQGKRLKTFNVSYLSN